MTKPHKHAALIKQWADNPELIIECKACRKNYWVVVSSPVWSTSCDYRIKPEPEPDFAKYAYVGGVSVCSINTVAFRASQYPADDLKLVFDGETGKLKSAEVLR